MSRLALCGTMKRNPIVRDFEPGDAPAYVRLASSVRRLPVSMETYEKRERMWPLSDFRRRRVATVDDAVVAVGSIAYSPYAVPCTLQLELIVDETMRAQGIGSLLLSDLMRAAAANGARSLIASVRDDFQHSVAWAERRGFVRQARRFESRLALATAPLALEGRSEGRRDDAILITDMAVEKDWDRLFDVFRRLLQDAPDMSGVPPWTVERCRDVLQRNPNARSDWIVVAISRGEWIGLSALHRMGRDAYNFFTGIDRKFRGQGIAQRLKLQLVHRARHDGIEGIRTNNLDRNAPMLAINRKLGFVEEPGFWEILRHVDQHSRCFGPARSAEPSSTGTT